MSIAVPYYVVTFSTTVASSSERSAYLSRVASALPSHFTRIGSSGVYQARISVWENEAISLTTSEFVDALQSSLQAETIPAATENDSDQVFAPISGRISFTVVSQVVTQE
jgi:hypothetical protein